MTGEPEVKREGVHVEVRPAGPGDVPALIALHQACFGPDEHILTLLGPRYIAAMYRWFLQGPDTFTQLAAVEGRVVGLITACSRPYAQPLLKATAWAALAGALSHPWNLFHPAVRRRLGAGHGPDTDDPAALGAEPAQFGFIAVDPAFHGARVGEAMIGMALKECRARGWTRVRAGIYQKNLPARFMYSKLGFKENKSLRTGDMLFMEKELLS